MNNNTTLTYQKQCEESKREKHINLVFIEELFAILSILPFVLGGILSVFGILYCLMNIPAGY